ncbi:MAG: carboxypeptidase regulatory-like domain-containing protein [Planctomycetota bacterium]
MSPDGRILDRNLEALLSRAYVPVLPRPAFRAELVRTVRAEVARRHGVRPGRVLRFALPLAAAAALLLWLGLGGALGGGTDAPQRTATAAELVETGRVALRGLGEPSWRAATEAELEEGYALDNDADLEVATPLTAALALRGPGADAVLQRSSAARFLPLPSAGFEAPGPGRALLLTGGELRLTLGAEARPWWIFDLAGNDCHARVLPGAEVQAFEEAGQTSVLLVAGTAEVVRGTEVVALRLGEETLLRDPRVADGSRGELGDPGQAEGGRRPVEEAPVDAGGEAEEQTAPLRRAAVRGTVRNAAGEPIPSFRVMVLLDREVPQVERPEVRTFEDGAFLWDDLAPEAYELFVEADGFAQHRAGVLRIEEGEPLSLDVVLGLGRSFRGWVLDGETEAPLPGAQIVVETEVPSRVLPFDLDPLPEWLTRAATSGSGGDFELSDMRSGTAILRVDAEGYAPTWVEVPVPASDTPIADVFVRMRSGGGIEGRVSGTGGVPLEGAVLLATLADDPTMSRLFSYEQAVTDAEGRYSFDNLAPAFYMMVQWDTSAEFYGGSSPTLRPVFVERDQVSTLNFGRADTAVRITGRFAGAAGPGPHKFTLLPSDDIEVDSTTEWQASSTDAEGRYEVTVAKPGSYLVFLTLGMGERLSLVDEIVVPEGETRFEHDVIVGKLHVEGRVTSGPALTPVRRAEVVLVRLGEREVFSGRAIGGEDGSFAFTGLGPGTYLVIASAYGDPTLGTAVSGPFELSAGDEDAEPLVAELVLPPGGELRVRAEDEQGKPLAGVRIELHDGNGKVTWAGLSPDTSAKGELVISALNTGTYRVRATLDGYSPAETRATVRTGDGGDAVLRLLPLE